MIKSIKFRNVTDDFKTKMKNDISEIKSFPNVFISADKLFLSPNDYKKLPKRIKNQQTVWSMH